MSQGSGERTVQAPRVRPRGTRTIKVVVLEGADAGSVAHSTAGVPLAIGSADDNELTLQDQKVSRYHIEVTSSPYGIVLKDLGSLNGTWVDRVRVEKATIPSGTQIKVGQSLLSIEEESTGSEQKAEEKAQSLPGVVFKSAIMEKVARNVRQLAPSMASVLLTGETGTGKEVIARALHELSGRPGPFVVVDCGSMAPNLIASELFGHERGAFTGAERKHVGAFERAAGGTIFLDEIGELPIEVQPALLGVLERKTFRRVGGDKEVDSDVRVVSATHRDLRNAANSGAFRADLYFRLAVAKVPIPPLRERTDDIEPLAYHFAELITGTPGELPFDLATLDSLLSYHFRGNVRELRNVVESAVAMGQIVLEERDPEKQVVESESYFVPDRSYRDSRAHAIARFERGYLKPLIESCEGNASEAARRAKMDRAYLVSLLKKHNLR